jgi:Zn-dependent protease
MKWSFKIADIAGIKIQVYSTFLIIVAWFALAYWQLEGTLRGALEGVSFILALFFCVVLQKLRQLLKTMMQPHESCGCKATSNSNQPEAFAHPDCIAAFMYL